MASFDHDFRSGNYHIRFRFVGKPYKRSLPLADRREAERVCGVVEETIKDLKRGRLEMPQDADPGAFLISGGKLTGIPEPVAPEEPGDSKTAGTLGRVFALYKETLTPGSKGRNTLETEAIHARHIQRVLGEGRAFDAIDVAVLQQYVDARAKEGVTRDTIKKELATLRVVWGWAFGRRKVASPVTWKLKELTLPKGVEKPLFQTWDQITRRIRRGGLTDSQEKELWDALWLDEAETVECLSWIKEHTRDPYVYPLFAFAAYTGARRGELLRSERDDWDFDSGFVSIRGMKDDRTMEFTRRLVPIHPDLAAVMTAWFQRVPGSNWAVSTTDGRPIGERMATRYFRRTVRGGKWEVLRGWHVFRHSLASNMAVAGVDQRDINKILGHRTDDMERRYQHLSPRKQEQSIHAMFNAKAS